MSSLSLPVLVGLIVAALAFDFLNGLHDTANSIATLVSTRMLRPRYAVMWAAFFNFIAFLVFGVHVARTIGVGIIAADVMDAQVIFGALTGAILWNFTLFPLKSPANLGSAVPTSWTLQNASGSYITDLSTLVKLESVFNGSTVPNTGCVASLTGAYQTIYTPPNSSTGNSSFRVVSPGFQFNWDTSTAAGTGAGCYTVKITLNDGTPKMTNAVQLK